MRLTLLRDALQSGGSRIPCHSTGSFPVRRHAIRRRCEEESVEHYNDENDCARTPISLTPPRQEDVFPMRVARPSARRCPVRGGRPSSPKQHLRNIEHNQQEKMQHAEAPRIYAQCVDGITCERIIPSIVVSTPSSGSVSIRLSSTSPRNLDVAVIGGFRILGGSQSGHSQHWGAVRASLAELWNRSLTIEHGQKVRGLPQSRARPGNVPETTRVRKPAPKSHPGQQTVNQVNKADTASIGRDSNNLSISEHDQKRSAETQDRTYGLVGPRPDPENSHVILCTIRPGKSSGGR
jgi:hypothetical protein